MLKHEILIVISGAVFVQISAFRLQISTASELLGFQQWRIIR